MQATPTNSSLCPQNGPISHHRADTGDQTLASPTIHAAYAVLKNRVSAKRVGYPYYKAITNRFYKSAANFCAFYGLELQVTQGLPFPKNLQVDFASLKQQFDKTNRPLCLFVASEAPYSGTVATAFRYQPEDLFIPIRQLHYWLRYKKYQSLAAMVTGTFKYLHHAGVAYFQSGTSIHQIYNDIYEWIWSDEMPMHFVHYMQQQLDRASDQGADVLDAMKAYDEQQWQDAVTSFKPCGRWQKKIKTTCRALLKLSLQFPGRKLTQLAFPELATDEDWEVSLDKLIGFYYEDGNTFKYEVLSYIGAERFNGQDLYMPMGIQLFDTLPTIEDHGLDFEMALTKQVENLIQLLTAFKIRHK